MVLYPGTIPCPPGTNRGNLQFPRLAPWGAKVIGCWKLDLNPSEQNLRVIFFPTMGNLLLVATGNSIQHIRGYPILRKEYLYESTHRHGLAQPVKWHHSHNSIDIAGLLSPPPPEIFPPRDQMRDGTKSTWNGRFEGSPQKSQVNSAGT